VFHGCFGDCTTMNWRSVLATEPCDRLLDLLVHRSHPYCSAHRGADDAVQSDAPGEDRRDGLGMGDQRFVLERQLRLRAIPVCNDDGREVAPFADPGAALKREACAVRGAAELGVELQLPRLDEAQDGIFGHLDHALGAALRVAEDRVHRQEREDQHVELRRHVLLRRVHRVDLQEVLDRYRLLAAKLQVLDVHG
jgi:hypothetical protein